MNNPLPFSDEICSDFLIRTFSSDLKEEDLYWHKDKKDRLIMPVQGTNWFLQYDNQLPIPLEINKIYPVKRESWHRILKGDSTLILKIKEF